MAHGGATSGAQASALLERESEVSSIAGWLADARRGNGTAAIVRASAGLGKTVLLEHARTLAGELGLRVYRARGSELEAQMPFGVARQLFEATLQRLDPADRDAAFRGAAQHCRSLFGFEADSTVAPDLLGVIDGLYWLAVNLADSGPLLLTLDDLHWADAPTLRWLGYLSTRIGDIPLLVLGAVREGDPGDEPVMSTLGPEAALIGLRPLGIDSAAALVTAQFDAPADPAFVSACHHAAGGNPFFLIELLRAAAVDGVVPTEDHAARLQQLGVRDISRSILIRLARLGETAQLTATVVAVLASDAQLRHVADLCEMPIGRVLQAWDELVGASILQSVQPLEFIHPIARTVVYQEIPVGQRTRLHRRAVGILAADGAGAQQIATHALACEPAGDEAVVGWLRAAARDAIGAGATDAASRYLRRAIQEPPPVELRGEVHFELGRALTDMDIAGAVANLDRAAELTADDTVRVMAYRWSGYALQYAGLTREGITAFDKAIALTADPELSLLIAGSRDQFAAWWTEDPDRAGRWERIHELAGTLAGTTPGELRVLGASGVEICLSGRATAGEALALSERAAARGVTFVDRGEGDETAGTFGTISLLCDGPEASVYKRLWPETLRSGRIFQGTFMRSVAAQVAFRRGDLVEAEEDARACWELFAALGAAPTTTYWWALTPLLQVLIGRGLVAEATALAQQTGLARAELEIAIFPHPAVIWGQLQIAGGRPAEGIVTLLDIGNFLESRGFTNPTHIPWRAHVAPAMAAAGRVDEARDVISVAVQRARRFGSPWALGMALRAAGMVETGTAGIELLQQAVEVLGPTVCRLEHAHAELELGAALRREGHRGEARRHLKIALDLASRSAADDLIKRATAELAVAGARPRRVMLSGPDSLTASERRVADLAADGLSNAEIAQSLFVTRKTVETHLGHVYLKLEISGREELAAALAA